MKYSTKQDLLTAFTFISGFLTGVALSCFLLCGTAHASGTYKVSWTQGDCIYVDHWVLTMDGTDIASLDAPCDGTMNATTLISGVGPHAFAMRAVTASGFSSEASNEIGIVVPLVAPYITALELQSEEP